MEKLLTAPGAGVDIDHRARLVEGMAAAIHEKGYAAATIADVVRHARVSKRTFYEHFADKEECFLACYSHAAEGALHAVAGAAEAAAADDAPWPERVRVTAHAYLVALQSRPTLTRTLLLEVHAAGTRALAVRRAVLERFADLLRSLVDDGRRQYPQLRPLRATMAVALVGGINELVLNAVERGDAARLSELEDTIVELVGAVLVGPPRAARGPDQDR
jgi:AcrR family transcriptional regulator